MWGIRDAYCVFPGCSRPAWRPDIDHTDEYDHDDLADGGQTRPGETKCLCRFDQLLKSFGDCVDFQDIDATAAVASTCSGETTLLGDHHR
jgi:hypothetical protein